jgi:hypothetical protein
MKKAWQILCWQISTMFMHKRQKIEAEILLEHAWDKHVKDCHQSQKKTDTIFFSSCGQCLYFSSKQTMHFKSFIHNSFAMISLNLTSWRDANPGSSVLKADAMTTRPPGR